MGTSTLCLLRMINKHFGLFSQRIGLSKGKRSIVRGTLYGECLRRRGARHSSQLQVQGQEVAPDSGTRVLGIFGGNGRFASKVGFSSELESTRNVGNQRCCNMQNNNSQHLYTRIIRRIAGASVLCSLPACTVLRMESRLLLRRGSLTYS